ncbi:MAG: hypothetical protein RL692_593 [Planctomycetota bacterium]
MFGAEPYSATLAVMHRFPIKRNRVASFVLIFATALCFAAPARAQGTSGQVPDPMSAVELSQLLNLYVHPTKEQGVAIEGLHDGYRERFRLLRENEIEHFLTKTKAMQGGMPKKEQIEEFTKSYERVNKQIAEVDDSFFDGVVTLMGEERRISVQRARDARSRTRSNGGMLRGLMSQYPSVDLSAIALEMGLTSEELATIDPMLAIYEQNLTASIKDLGVASMRMIRDVYDELEKAGVGEHSQEDMMKDPEKMKQMIEITQSAMAKAGERVKAKSRKLSEFNNKTCQALAGQLTGDSKRKLRTLYLAKAYPELSSDPLGANVLFKRALRLKKLDEAAREQIRAAYLQWQAADDAFVEQSIKEIDESRANHKQMDFFGSKDNAKRMVERMKQRKEIAISALKSVSPLVGNPQLQVMFEFADSEGEMNDETEEAIADGDDASTGEESSGINARAADAEDPLSEQETVITNRGPMGESAIDLIATQLALDDSGKALLKTMHQDYMKNWDEEIRTEQSRVDDLNTGRWARAAKNSDDMNVYETKQTAYFNGRKALLQKSTEVDEAFLNELSSVLGEKSTSVLQMAKLERVLERLEESNQRMLGRFTIDMPASESPVNIVTVLNSAKLSPEELAKVREALAMKIDPLIKDQLTSLSQSIDQERRTWGNETAQLAHLSSQNEEKPDMVEMQKLGMETMAIKARQSELKTKRTAAVRAAWATAIAPLGEKQQASLQLAFDEHAYPSIFKDSRSASPFIEKALLLQDLSDDQRKQLQSLCETSRAEHVDFCRKMLPKKAAGPSPTQAEEMQQYWQEQMQVANAREKIRFERDEHSQRAISAIRRILNESQVNKINGLADYEKSATKKNQDPFGIE